MKTALYPLGFQGLIGAFDTFFYHEWKARLPARGRRAAPELILHAARDFFYGVLFCTLPWFAWKGTSTIVLLGVIVAEIILTLWDFVVEITVRRDLGDVQAGERVTHAVMGIMLEQCWPVLLPRWPHRGEAQPVLPLSLRRFQNGCVSLSAQWARASEESWVVPVLHVLDCVLC